jgi:hypothetical protein
VDLFINGSPSAINSQLDRLCKSEKADGHNIQLFGAFHQSKIVLGSTKLFVEVRARKECASDV